MRARHSAPTRSADRSRRRWASSAAPGRRDEERERSVESLRAAAEYAATRDVTIVIEYLNRFEMYLVNCAEDAASLVRDVDHPNCRMMYDTFHAHIEEADPRAALQSCADVLAHFHASENNRGTPGSGQVDWDTTFDALGEIGYARLGRDRSVRRLAARPRRGDEGVAADVLERGAARPRRSGIPAAPARAAGEESPRNERRPHPSHRQLHVATRGRLARGVGLPVGRAGARRDRRSRGIRAASPGRREERLPVRHLDGVRRPGRRTTATTSIRRTSASWPSAGSRRSRTSSSSTTPCSTRRAVDRGRPASHAYRPLCDLHRRYGVSRSRASDGAGAGTARPRGRVPRAADLLRSDAPEQRLRARGAQAGSPVRGDLRRVRGGGVAVVLVRRDGAGDRWAWTTSSSCRSCS